MLKKMPEKSYKKKKSLRWIAAILTLILGISAVYLFSTDFKLIKTIVTTPTPMPTPTPTPIPTPTPEPTPTPTPPPPGKKVSDVIVVVDPGHGGRDPGTVSPYKDNFNEKEVVLDMGLKLKDKLEQAGIQVVMTRDTDVELATYWKEDVWARPRIANEAKATFFISIHVNSVDIKKLNPANYHGTEVYHWGKTHGEFTSKQFGQMLGEEIDAATDTKYNGVIKADFGVLRLSEMPALLVETAYMTNKDDHRRLESDDFREDMVEGIFNGTIRILDAMGAFKENGFYKLLVDE